MIHLRIHRRIGPTFIPFTRAGACLRRIPRTASFRRRRRQRYSCRTCVRRQIPVTLPLLFGIMILRAGLSAGKAAPLRGQRGVVPEPATAGFAPCWRAVGSSRTALFAVLGSVLAEEAGMLGWEFRDGRGELARFEVVHRGVDAGVRVEVCLAGGHVVWEEDHSCGRSTGSCAPVNVGCLPIYRGVGIEQTAMMLPVARLRQARRREDSSVCCGRESLLSVGRCLARVSHT